MRKSQMDENENNRGKNALKFHERAQRIRETLKAQNQAKESQVGEWSFVQDLLQEIQAEDRIERKGKSEPLTKQLEKLKEKIKTDFGDDISFQEIALKSIPTYRQVRKWM